MQIIETKVYTFNELNDDAKEKARAWYRGGALDYDWYAAVYEYAKECAKLMGIEIYRIYFSGFWSQGDGACFEGRYAYQKGAIKAIKQHAPLDTTLHHIAKDLQLAQRPAFYRLCANVKQRGHYSHSGCTDIEVYNREAPYDDVKQEEDIKEALRDFMDWIYNQLEKEYEFQHDDAQVDESIIANEYTFTQSGKRFG